MPVKLKRHNHWLLSPGMQRPRNGRTTACHHARLEQLERRHKASSYDDLGNARCVSHCLWRRICDREGMACKRNFVAFMHSHATAGDSRDAWGMFPTSGTLNPASQPASQNWVGHVTPVDINSALGHQKFTRYKLDSRANRFNADLSSFPCPLVLRSTSSLYFYSGLSRYQMQVLEGKLQQPACAGSSKVDRSAAHTPGKGPAMIQRSLSIL